jgi:carboxypeptidase C (cathepsin A)
MPDPIPDTPSKRPLSEDPPVETTHELKLADGTLKYKVTAGMLPLKTEFGEHEANVFFMAYTKIGGKKNRPLMFSFNGGPGSSSVWLHLGALGPKRVRMEDDGALPPPPYKLVDNPHTWLNHTDIVFIDPVGTGYSRAANKEIGKKFWGVKGDIDSLSEVIRLYLTRYERWDSPLFMVGESYGTTRAAGLSAKLIEMGIAFNGIMLVSSILNFQTARFNKGNDLPYILFLPTYCATAWFHKRAGTKSELETFLKDCEQFAIGEYASSLAKGDRLKDSEKTSLIKKLAQFTGLSETYIDYCNLRVEIMQFCKELLRDRRRTVGRLDSRFLGIEEFATGEKPDHDPSMTAIRPPYTSMFNQYVRNELGFKTDVEYKILGGGIEEPWDWGSAGDGHPDTSEALREAFAKNPHMKLFVASGYYDLATPYFATEYTLSHLGLDPNLRDNIRVEYYPAGHMMYIDVKCLEDLAGHAASFIRSAS